VLVYRVEAWEPCASDAEGEIHAVGWFDPTDLPEETTGPRAAHRRGSGRSEDPDW
jgi:hypothetical protein